jgi:thiamine kinase-like enzyme
MPVIDEIVSRIEDWKDRHISIQALSGGLTNTNYKVTVDETPFFVRVPGESTALLAIDRRNEYFNAKAAAETGVGPKVLYHLPEFQAMIMEFIQGITMSNASLNNPGMPTKIATAIKRLHAGPRFLSDFNMFRLT